MGTSVKTAGKLKYCKSLGGFNKIISLEFRRAANSALSASMATVSTIVMFIREVTFSWGLHFSLQNA